MKFKNLIKNEMILKSLEESGYINPTPIQEKIIPLVFDGRDVLGQSQTGTGKTLAFAGPILDSITENKTTQTLILAPTRELAIQISSDISKYAKYTKFNVVCVYGSSSIESQIKELNRGTEIVVGTPGRVKDLIKRKKLKLTEISFFVLDEADEMLSMGFQEEIEYIFKSINNDKQVLLFSATMPKKILDIARDYMSIEYETVVIESDNKISSNIKQYYYVTKRSTKTEALSRILDFYNSNKGIIFVKTKKNADELLEELTKRGYNSSVIHGDIIQSQRIKSLDLFKTGYFNYLIATDVAARGIHVDNVDLVINYNLPDTHESYIHRIGRTGRGSNLGTSITIITDNEEKDIEELQRNTKSKIVKQEFPKLNHVINTAKEVLIEKLDEIKLIRNDFESLNEYINSLTNDEKDNLILHFIQKELMKNIRSDFNIDLEPSKKKRLEKRLLGDSTRVFLTIGKIDNINKKELLDFIEKRANVKSGTCTGVEILTKFTFMNIKNSEYNKVFKAINNTRYKKRVIRVEIAKK